MHLVRQRLRTVFDAAGNDDELPRPEVTVTIAQLHTEPTLDHKEQLVLPLVMVPDKLSPQLHQLYVGVVQITYDFRRQVLPNAPHFILQVDDLHRCPPKHTTIPATEADQSRSPY